MSSALSLIELFSTVRGFHCYNYQYNWKNDALRYLVAYLHTRSLFYSVVGQSIGVYASSSSMQPLACAEIELVKANDPADTDVIVAFPETNDFER